MTFAADMLLYRWMNQNQNKKLTISILLIRRERRRICGAYWNQLDAGLSLPRTYIQIGSVERGSLWCQIRWRRRTVGWKDWPNLVMCKTDKFILRETFRSVVFRRERKPPALYGLCVILPALVIAEPSREREKDRTICEDAPAKYQKKQIEYEKWLNDPKQTSTIFRHHFACIFPVWCGLISTSNDVLWIFENVDLWTVKGSGEITSWTICFLAFQFNAFAVFAWRSHFCLFIIITFR